MQQGEWVHSQSGKRSTMSPEHHGHYGADAANWVWHEAAPEPTKAVPIIGISHPPGPMLPLTFTKEQMNANPVGKTVDKAFGYAILAVAIFLVILFLLYVVPSLAHGFWYHALEPQGTGELHNKSYSAEEINRFYSLPWRRGMRLQLGGYNITVTGDLKDVNIVGMGNITFQGNLTDSQIVDHVGSITVHNVSHCTLSGKDLKVLGVATNTKEIIEGDAPARRKYHR